MDRVVSFVSKSICVFVTTDLQDRPEKRSHLFDGLLPVACDNRR